jgi:hypothetical protein
MIKSPAVYYYYAYKSDDGVLFSLPTIPTARSVEQLKKMYEMYKNNLTPHLKNKKHLIVEVTTTYKQIEL